MCVCHMSLKNLFTHLLGWNKDAGINTTHGCDSLDWIGLYSVLRPLQNSIRYIGDGFYRSKDPTNSIEVLKENLQKTNQTTETTQNRHE